MRQSTKWMTASAALLVVGAGVLGVSYWPREHEAAATAAVPGAECRMTPIPPAGETAEAIESTADGIADDVRRYGEAAQKPLPPGVTHDQLVAEAKTKIDEQLTRIDELETDALDLIAGKTESPHTTRFFLRPCVMSK